MVTTELNDKSDYFSWILDFDDLGIAAVFYSRYLVRNGDLLQ